jgi:CRISPR-associated protein Cas6
MNIITQQSITPASASNIDTSPYVVVYFPVQGSHLPTDHGYALYSAITQKLPALCDASWLGIELINGIPWREGLIVLPSRGASLRLHIPANRLGDVLPLAGHNLNIASHSVNLGIPVARPIQPARSLCAHIVIIEGFSEPEPFLDAAHRIFDALGLRADLELPINEQGGHHRHFIKIHGGSIIGFPLAAHNLSDNDSVQLQSVGIGQHRKMGCGIFNPIANPATQKEQR